MPPTQAIDATMYSGKDEKVMNLETDDAKTYVNVDNLKVIVFEPDGGIEMEEHVDEEELKEKDCFVKTLDSCCSENVRELRDCACCLKQCTDEIYSGLRRIDCKQRLKRTLNLESVKEKLPILKWLPNYRVQHFVGDLVAGVTVGLTIIPKSLGATKVALLPPEYAMYTSMVCVFVYIFFGTAKDLNLGPTNVLSLLVSKFGKSPIEGDASYAIALSLMCGIVQLVLGIFHLGFIVNFISYPVLESFTTASVITIAFGQIPSWLGLTDIPKAFLPQLYWICKKLPETNLWDFLLGLVCLIVLIFWKKMESTICARRKATSLPDRILSYLLWLFGIGKTAVVVILGIVVAYVFHLHGLEPLTLTKNVPAGLPPFKPPSFTVTDGNVTYFASDMFKTFGTGIITVPLISFISTMAIIKNFARKSNYRVHKDQELIASGIANVVGSFLSAYPISGSFSGSSVNFKSGARTTACGLYTGVLVMLVLLFLTPIFYYIPSATLGVVVMVAVLEMVNFRIVIKLWNVKKIDLIPWFLTFVCSLCLGIEIGIIIGIAVSICILIYPTSRPKVTTKQNWNSISLASSGSLEYAVLLIEQGLAFPSVEYFVDHVMACVIEGGNCVFKSVILDFVHVSSVDFSLVEGLEQLAEDFTVMDVQLILCRVRRQVQKVLRKCGIKDLICTNNVEEAIQLIKHNQSPSGSTPVEDEEETTDDPRNSIFVVSANFVFDDTMSAKIDTYSGSDCFPVGKLKKTNLSDSINDLSHISDEGHSSMAESGDVSYSF